MTYILRTQFDVSLLTDPMYTNVLYLCCDRSYVQISCGRVVTEASQYDLSKCTLSCCIVCTSAIWYKTDGTGCIDDRLYSAVLRSLEQTHCARMWFYMSY